MATVEHVESRAECAEAIANARAEVDPLRRRGHEGLHESCDQCDMVGLLHNYLDYLLTCWQEAPPA
jgi:hypothetical protein